MSRFWGTEFSENAVALRVAKLIQKAGQFLAAFFCDREGGTLRLNPLTTKGTKVHEVDSSKQGLFFEFFAGSVV